MSEYSLVFSMMLHEEKYQCSLVKKNSNKQNTDNESNFGQFGNNVFV